MAKKSMVEREKKRARLRQKYEAKTDGTKRTIPYRRRFWRKTGNSPKITGITPQ